MSKIPYEALADSQPRMYNSSSNGVSSNGVDNENRLNNLCTCPPIPRACGNCNGLPPPPTPGLSIVIQDSGEHCHDDEQQFKSDKVARRKLWIASVLCVVFMIGEAVGGVLAGSLAVATDAAHLLTDFAGFMISLFALYISERPATKRLSYGYHRAEVIGALTSVLLIWVVTGILVYLAVQRVVMQEFEIDAPIMLITSGIGLVVNVIMGCTLHQHGHGHSHGGGGHGHSHGGHHGHSHTPERAVVEKPPPTPKVEGKVNNSYVPGTADDDIERANEQDDSQTNGENESSASSCSSDSTSTQVTVAKPQQNINVRAAYIHVIGDFLQSVGVFAAALVIYFEPKWTIIDPICTFLFSILVMGTTFAIIKDALVVLMEGAPKGIDFNDVRETLLSVRGVYKVHNLRIWSLSMDKIAMSAHLAVEPGSRSTNSILRKSSQLVKTKFNFCEVTIQIEDFNHSMQDCRKCEEPRN